jgi:hypothetical protein
VLGHVPPAHRARRLLTEPLGDAPVVEGVRAARQLHGHVRPSSPPPRRPPSCSASKQMLHPSSSFSFPSLVVAGAAPVHADISTWAVLCLTSRFTSIEIRNGDGAAAALVDRGPAPCRRAAAARPGGRMASHSSSVRPRSRSGRTSLSSHRITLRRQSS